MSAPQLVQGSSSLSDARAQLLAEDVERWCRRRWLVMWQPYSRAFAGYPMYDHAIAVPVEAKSARKLWRRIIDVDQALAEQATAEIAVLRQPAVGYVPASFLREVLG
ncbi:hypothetical protein ACFWY5_46525 [Nonomuraea sp. NPDC059007]|uniref:hypothetical protein n=1 Tax=Nonomuraea sp. NPDC059007 TaxID=3346692 RepID=UPI0036BE3A73